jgi:hypothetical protein
MEWKVERCGTDFPLSTVNFQLRHAWRYDPAAMSFEIPKLSETRFANTVLVSIVASALIVAVAASLGRAMHNLQGALSADYGKPELALQLLLPDEGITDTTILRSTETEQHILAETRNGPKLVKLEIRDGRWAVAEVEPLRESEE